MITHFKKYYQSETQNAWMRILSGLVASIGVGGGYFFIKNELFAGVCTGLVSIALYQIGRGVKKLARARGRKQQIRKMDTEPTSELLNDEMYYLEHRLPKYKFHRNMQILFIGLGIVLLLVGSIGRMGYFTLGIGIGLAVQSVVALYLELVAEWYAGIFHARLKKYLEKK